MECGNDACVEQKLVRKKLFHHLKNKLMQQTGSGVQDGFYTGSSIWVFCYPAGFVFMDAGRSGCQQACTFGSGCDIRNICLYNL